MNAKHMQTAEDAASRMEREARAIIKNYSEAPASRSICSQTSMAYPCEGFGAGELAEWQTVMEEIITKNANIGKSS